MIAEKGWGLNIFDGGTMDFQLGKNYNELKIGDKASFTKTFTETDFYLFAGISGDFNPLHVNDEFAKLTLFKTRIGHGVLPQKSDRSGLGNSASGPGNHSG